MASPEGRSLRRPHDGPPNSTERALQIKRLHLIMPADASPVPKLSSLFTGAGVLQSSGKGSSLISIQPQKPAAWTKGAAQASPGGARNRNAYDPVMVQLAAAAVVQQKVRTSTVVLSAARQLQVAGQKIQTNAVQQRHTTVSRGTAPFPFVTPLSLHMQPPRVLGGSGTVGTVFGAQSVLPSQETHARARSPVGLPSPETHTGASGEFDTSKDETHARTRAPVRLPSPETQTGTSRFSLSIMRDYARTFILLFFRKMGAQLFLGSTFHTIECHTLRPMVLYGSLGGVLNMQAHEACNSQITYMFMPRGPSMKGGGRANQDPGLQLCERKMRIAVASFNIETAPIAAKTAVFDTSMCAAKPNSDQSIMPYAKSYDKSLRVKVIDACKGFA